MKIIVDILLLVILLVLVMFETEIQIRLRTRSLKSNGVIIYNIIKYLKIIDALCIIVFNC